LTVAELMQMLGSVQSENARFVETRHSALLSAPLVLKGTLAYQRPDRLEKNVLAPYEEKTVIAAKEMAFRPRVFSSNRSFRYSGTERARLP